MTDKHSNDQVRQRRIGFKKRAPQPSEQVDGNTDSDVREAGWDDLDDNLGDTLEEFKANFTILEDLDDHERLFRQLIIQRRLGKRDEEAPDFKNVIAAQNTVANVKQLIEQSGREEKSLNGLFLTLLAKSAGLKEKGSSSPTDWPLLAWSLDLLALVAGSIFGFGYLALLLYNLVIHFENDGLGFQYDSSSLAPTTITPPLKNSLSGILFTLVKESQLLFIIFMCWKSRFNLKILLNDRLMLEKTVQFTNLKNPIHIFTFLLGTSFMVLECLSNYNIEKKEGIFTDGSLINNYLAPTLLGARMVTEALAVWYNILISMICRAWCMYVREIAQTLRMDLDEDSIVCEYNHFVKEYKKKMKSSPETSRSRMTDDQLKTLDVIPNSEILLRHTHLKERLDFTSKRFEFWLFINLFWVILYGLVFFIRYLYIRDTVTGIELIMVAMVFTWLPLFTSAVLRLNAQLNNIKTHIFPLASRGSVFALMAAAPANISIYGGPLSYGSIATIFVAFFIGLATRLLSLF